jgi:predicted secreted protein
MLPTSGYINGSDILLSVGGKAVGHCTNHTLTFNSETKDRAVKPVASAGYASGLWKGKGITGLSISISAEGLRYYGETENGFDEIAAQWGVGQSVQVKAFQREGDASPYVQGNFVITSIEEGAPSQDDATYNVSLESDGEPDMYPGKNGGLINLNVRNIKLVVGDKFTILPAVLPNNASVTYSSSASAKASVTSGGVVTAAQAGSAVITGSITVDGKTYTDTCNVTVVAA